MESKLTLFKKWKILFVFLALICCSTVADASHFRGGTISSDCGAGNEVTFTITASWRASFFGTTGIGQNTGFAMFRFNLGDGTSILVPGTSTFYNAAEDWATYTSTVTHTYSTPGAYTAFFQDCCRLGTLPNGWADDPYRLQATVNAGPSCNEAPTLATPAFINVPPGNFTTCFQLNASDPEGDPITWSLGTTAETGMTPSPASAWPGGTLSATGELCVNSTTMPGAPSGGYTNGTLIPISLKVSDDNGNGTIPGDILFKIATSTGVAPTWDYGITPADGSTLTFFADVIGAFGFEAEDADAGNTVSIFPSGLPAGTSFSPGLPNASNPNSTTLSWTPTAADAGTYPVTLIAQDNTGLQTQTSFSIEVITCSAPVAVCTNVTIGLDVTGAAVLNPTTVGSGSTASCGLDTETVTPNTFDCSHDGSTVTVTYTITDINGTSDQCTAQVTIADMIAPDPVCDQNASTTLDPTGFRTILASQMDAGSDDNCTAPGDLRFSYSTDINDTERIYTCDDIGFNAVSIWIWDLAGNISVECEAVLFVADNTAPDCKAHPTLDVVLDHMGMATITVADIDNGSTDACGIETMSIDITDFDCADIANNPHTVTLTTIDTSGNTSMCTTQVTVQDLAHIHVHCRDTLLSLNSAGMVIINAEDVIVPGSLYDNCGIMDTTVSPSMLDCNNIGTATTVTLTVTDVNGNTETCQAQVTVQDMVAPTAVCQNVTVQLDAAGNGSLTPGMLDGGSSDACGIDALAYSATQTSFTCSDIGDVTVTLTVTDNNGNTAECDATVTVEDNVAPVMNCQDFDIYLDANGSAIATSVMADGGTSDNCMITSLTVGPEEVGCEDTDFSEFTLIGEYSGRRYYLSNNSFTWVDAKADAQEHGGELSAFTDAAEENFVKTVVGIQAWIGYNDMNVEGDFVWTNGEADAYTNWDGGEPNNVGNEDGTVMNWLGPRWNDLPANSGSFLRPYVLETAITAAGEVSIVLVAEDQSGNTASCLSIATVIDTIKPIAICKNITVQLDSNGDVGIIATDVDDTSTDACGIDSYEIDIDEFDCSNVGANDVVLTVTDVNGNESTCTAVVTVEDNVDPNAVCKNIIIQLDATGEVSIGGLDVNDASNDACGIDTMYVDTPDFTCADVGDNTVTLTVVDNNGNEATCTSTVTVEDNVDPDCIAKDSTLILDFFDGTGSITAAELDDGSTDACGIAGFLVRRVGDVTFEASVDFGCDDVATPVAVEIQVEDANGNTSICSSTVTVVDNSSPFLNCEDEVTVSLNSQGLGKLKAHTLVASWGADDPCGLLDPTIDGEMMIVYDCDDVGTHDVIVSISDVNGNVTECTVTVVVVDQRDPECFTQPITVYLDALGTASVDSNAVDNGSYDNCEVESINLDITSFSCADTGGPVTVTQTVLDVNGNSKTCTELVTVLDTIKPECLTMDITVYLDSDGITSIDSNAVDNGSNDACGVALFALDVSDFTCADVGSPVTVTQTVTDVNGNTSQCTAIVTVEDNVAPEALCQNVIIMLDPSGNGTLDPNDLDNGSNDACGIIPVTASQTAFDCSHVGINIITLTVEDVNGNVSTCSDTVMVVDMVAPVALCQDVTIELDVNGEATLTSAMVNNGSNDACGIANVCIGKGVETSSLAGTLELTDPVFVYDDSDPALSCFDDPTIFSGCCNIVDGTHHYDQQQFSISASDTYTFTFNSTGGDFIGIIYDSSFNPVDMCQNIIYGDDDAGPFLDPLIVITLTMVPGDYILVTSTWNTPSTLGFDYSWDVTSDAGGTVSAFECASELDYTCLEVGENTVTLCATDVNGNVSYCSSTVTVEDNVAPTMNCMDIDVDLDEFGSATITSAMVDGGSTDACGIADLTVGPEEVGCDGTDFSEFTYLGENGGHTYYKSNNQFNFSDALADATEHGGILASISDATENGIAATLGGSSWIGFNDIRVEGDFVWYSGEAVSYTSWFGGEPNNLGNEDGTIINFGGSGLWNDVPVTLTYTYILEVATTNAGEVSVVLHAEDVNGNTASCLSVATINDVTAPDAVCMDIDLYLDAAGNASIGGADVDGGSTDACGIDTMYVDIADFLCANVGPNNVELSVVDGSGNIGTCTAVVTVIDTIDPVAVCKNITVQLDFNGTVSVSGFDIDDGSTDACGIASLDAGAGVTTFGCADVGANIVVLTVTDVNGNTSTCESTVTVEDNVAPLVNCVNNVEVPLNTDGIGFVTKEEVTGATFDACGVVDTFIIRNDIASHPDYGIENEMLFFDCSDIGLVAVIIRIYDTNGNVEECNTAVNVKDEILPTMECTSATIYLDESGVAALDSNALDNGSYDNCAIVEFSVSQTDFDCSHLGMNLITMTAEDQSGNSSSCSNVVMVLDTFAPVAMCKDITVQLNALGAATITGAMLDDGSTDACGPLTFTADMTAFDCSNVGTNTVTMTATDGSGNSSTCTSTVTVEDVTGPDCATQDITIQLDAAGNITITAAMVDDGSSDACGIASMSVSPNTFTCAEVGTNTVTLTLTDVNNNVSTCTAEVTVEDVTGPDCATQDITVQLDVAGNATITAAMVDDGSSDACGIASMSVSPNTFTCAEVGANTVTLTLTDVNNNVSTCTAEVTVEDVTGPDCATQDITVQLDAAGNATITTAMVDDGSSDACGIASMSVSPDAFTCAEVGANTVTLTLTDDNGNVSTCTAEVTVEDVTGPDCATQDITVQLDVAGNATITAAMVDDGSSDACGIASMSVSPNTFTCAEVGANTVTLTLTDVNNNVSICTAEVTVEDVTGPDAICMNITVELGDDGTVTIDSNAVDNGSTDACGITLFATDVTSFDCSSVGDNTVEMTVTDIHGNASSCTATVTVIDVTGPELTCPADITVNTLPSDCNQNVIMPTLFPTDVCTGSATYEYVSVDITFIETGIDTFALFPVGDTEVTVIATDGFGNTSECTFNVTVIDNINPIITGCDDIGSITVDGDMTQCGANVSWDETLINANDNCSGQGSGVAVTSDYSPGDLFPVGTTTVTYTATDDSGNTATCTFDVTVNPNAPTADFTYFDASLAVSFTNASSDASSYAWDFGDSNTTTATDPTHNYAAAGTYNVCLTASDVCGNEDTYCEDVTVADSGNLCIDEVTMVAGWNLISFDVDPADSSIGAVFGAALGTSIDYISSYDNGAMIYNPSAPIPALNTLQNIAPGFGYWVLCSADVTIVTSGACIDASFKKDLDLGWNLVSFIPQAPESPSFQLDDLITPGILEFATTYSPSTSTLIFDPSAPLPFLNTLQLMENGWGYWIKVNVPVSGSDWFGKTGDESSTRSENTDEWGNAKTSAYDFINGTISGAENGDLIDVVTEDGDLVIQLEVIADQYLMTTPLYADDSNTPDDIDGLINGQELSFVFNGITSEVVVTFEGSKIIHHVDLEFETTTSVEEIEEDRLSIYPNPMFSAATLSIDVALSGNYEVSIIDATGKVVRSMDLGVLPAGNNRIALDRDHLGAGSYIVLVQNTNQKSIARLPIIIIN